MVPISDRLVNLELFPLLLPAHRGYVPETNLEEISVDKVDKILGINCHGDSGGATDDCHTELYPTTIMMNHAFEPNCTLADTTKVNLLHIVLTRRPIRAGEELTMKYHSSDEVVERKWGIKKN